jgi:transposase InsO family protein
MVTRAVFLELVPSLSTSDFLLALRKFISLYRKPEVIHSDNGTNFVGAERELREAVDEMYASQAIPDFMKRVSIKWTFQPPRTPHFGGAHESLVRSTKKALYNALEQEKNSSRHPTEDLLRTLLYEVAGLLNTRPLTYASSDPADFRPLTPNDFLNRPPTAYPPAGSFDDASPREHYLLLFYFIQFL